MRDLIFTSLIILAGCNLFSANSKLDIDISGMVYEKESGAPINGALIELWGDNFWGGEKLLERTFSGTTFTTGTGDYHIHVSTELYNTCDSTGIHLYAYHKIVYEDSTIAHDLPEGNIPINCDGNSRHIKRTINLGMVRR
ncbi:MAG TPA: hypothetical protein VJ964_07205 [Balneolaceae bacterium]|nr:hypothetical protein [Balneolaceae bacterium]